LATQGLSLYSRLQLILNAFKKVLDSEFSHQEGELITAELTISKAAGGNKISIYNLDVFISTIGQLNTDEAFTVFDRILSRSDSIVFSVFGLLAGFSTTSLHFLTQGSSAAIPENHNRQSRLESALLVSNYAKLKRPQDNT
jgi:hypothetical protein